MFILTLKGRPKGKLEETQLGHTHVQAPRELRQKLFNRAGATAVILATFCLALPLVQADDGAFLADGTTFVETDPVLSPPANVGAYEGGATGTEEDAGEDYNGANERVLPVGTEVKFDIPTGAIRTPLFGAQSFTQQMLRFEEFAPEPYPSSFPPSSSLPMPPDGHSGPDSAALEAFLADEMYPAATRMANDIEENPWTSRIEEYMGRPLDSPPADGRPPGEDWAHQRWNEFSPQTYFKTAQAGARMNGGLRDSKQLHGYSAGEFGPGADGVSGTSDDGLYHNTVGIPGFEGSTNGLPIRFHPNMPIQDQNSVWTFDGTLPPKLLSVRYGEGVLMRHYNALPIDPSANRGFGLHTITTHEHNGHSPAESDGYTNAFFYPGQFFDYRWPIQLAGYDTVNTTASDPRAATPCSIGETLKVLGVDELCTDGTIQIPGDWRETMSTHWFHDHMLDFTAQNVYKGNAAMMNYYSALDPGKEPMNATEAQGSTSSGCHYANPDNVNLCLPSGTALDWGNRDYDVNLLIADKAWDGEGQLFFNIFNTDGFVGDHILTNWLYHPYFEVRARKYRFRLLNGSVSRYFRFALVDQNNNPVPFHMVANDGNVMEHTVHFANGELPTQAIAERYDIIVDFSQFAPGTKLYFVNLLEHRDGRRPHEAIPLQEILSGEYRAEANGNLWEKGDPAVGKFLELRVTACKDAVGTVVTCVDHSMNPDDYVAGKKKMIPLPRATEAELANAIHRTFDFGRSNGTDDKPWTIKADGGGGFGMDPRRISAAPNIGDLTGEGQGHLEIWHLENGGGGWSHPIHIHFEEGIILERDGLPPPEWEQWARKDVYRIGRMEDSGDSVVVALRFREFAGSYMEHCHNTQHEDRAMLLRWDIENPGQVTLMPTPFPTWDGVTYIDSHALPTFRTGNGVGVPPPPPPPPANTPPTVGITAPVNGAAFTEGDLIVFTGSASDGEDGNVTASLDWTSSLDGVIGSGGSFSNTLSVGTHTITATATDSGGLTDSASINNVMVNTVAPPPPPPPVGNAVVKFVLWNADSDTVIVDLNDGDSLDLPALCGGCQVNVEAVAADPEGATERMVLSLTDATNKNRTEKGFPYMLAGDSGGNIFPMSFNTGAHTLTATPFSANSGGTAGTALTIGFSVGAALPPPAPATYTLTVGIDGTGTGTVSGSGISCPGDCTEPYADGTIVALSELADAGSAFAGWSAACPGGTVTMAADQTCTATFDLVPPPPPPSPVGNAVVKFVLWNANSDSVIGDLNEGDSLDLAALCGGCQVNVEAVAVDPEGATERMVLSVTDATNKSRTEKGFPYMLAGDTGGNIFPMSFNAGTHTLTATPYSANSGGTAGTALTINFMVQ